jgi:hypothetical protein
MAAKSSKKHLPFLKPCLVIGSGFHRWVLGKSSTPLTDWNALIDETASLMKVSLPSRDLSPVLRWERLIETAAKDGYQPSQTAEWRVPGKRQANEIESDAKKLVAQVLDQDKFFYPWQSRRAEYPKNQLWSSIVSLNFDHAWLQRDNLDICSTHTEEKYLGVMQDERDRLHYCLKLRGTIGPKIWFPNGCTVNPTSIRMGLHDYGTQPHSIKSAFKYVKTFENKNFKREEKDGWAKFRPILESALTNLDEGVNTWVADFLYRPIYFAGVGLSESELGLWWLLVQRARNFAKLSTSEIPPTVALVDGNSDRKSFWATRPCGVEAVYCDNWDYGWEDLMRRASELDVGSV